MIASHEYETYQAEECSTPSLSLYVKDDAQAKFAEVVEIEGTVTVAF